MLPYTLGRIVGVVPHIVLLEVTRVNREKNLIVYKHSQEILKGTHPGDEIERDVASEARGPGLAADHGLGSGGGEAGRVLSTMKGRASRAWRLVLVFLEGGLTPAAKLLRRF